MRHLLLTDPSLRQLEFQQEGNDDLYQLDGFYSQTLALLTKERNLKKIDNEKSELESLLRLEKLLESILMHKNQQKVKETKADEETLKKYVDFKEKTNKLLGLIDKTSRSIFREKYKEFTSKVNRKMKDYQRRSMGSISSLKKSAALGIYLTSVNQANQDESLTKVKVNGPLKSPSVSFPLTPNEDINKIFNSNNIFSSQKKRISTFEFDLNDNKKKDDKILPYISKKAIGIIRHIIEKTAEIQNGYQEERKNIGEFEFECNKFFKETKNRVNPPLESILITLEKPNRNFKFCGVGKKCYAARKHCV